MRRFLNYISNQEIYSFRDLVRPRQCFQTDADDQKELEPSIESGVTEDVSITTQPGGLRNDFVVLLKSKKVSNLTTCSDQESSSLASERSYSGIHDSY